MATQHALDNKAKLDALVSKARRRGFFPITKGSAFPARKCAHGCGVSVITFRNAKGEERFRCFRCGK